MELYNKLSAKQRAVLIEKAGGKRLTLSFYIYHEIKNCQLFRDHLYLKWNAIDVLGRIYIASEGINCLLYTSPSPRDLSTSRMPSSA